MMDTLRNGYVSMINNVTYISSLIQVYFWYILLSGIFFYFIYYKFIDPVLKHVCAKYFAYKKYKEEKDYEAQYHKNPDLFSARISAQQCYAEKLQEKYNQQIKEHEAKLQKKKEMMLLSNNVEHSGGYVLGRDDKKTKSLRSDYNPLMGYGSSSNYRPPKRSKCGGGGK